MNRLSVGHFTIIGLVFWGLPAVFVAGPRAILYTFVAVLFVWLLSRRSPAMSFDTQPAHRTGSTATFILVACALSYFVGDAVFGQKLLAINLFLHGVTAVDRVVDQANLGVSQGRGAVALLGTIIGLLPYCLIDVAGKARRFERWALWTAAILLLFYGVTTSRGAVVIAILTIVMGKTSNWRRISLAGGVAFGLFTLASVVRGDLATSHNPLGEAIGAPYVNLLLMRAAHCGSAPWYNYVAEFFKKFIPSFIYPKSIYSFNTETSLCIYPSADNNIVSVSIFTWLGEVFYYTPSILTAICAGALLGVMGNLVNRQLVRSELPCARIASGFAIIILLRSRSQDVLSYLIAQLLFLLFWPYLFRLSQYLRHCVKSSSDDTYPHGIPNDVL
jgi:hypothetical protein